MVLTRMKQSPSMENIRFLLGQEHECDYLPNRRARSVFLAPDTTRDAQLYPLLANQGFRRSGNLVYRPHCTECNACIPVRVPVHQFSPDRSQRRTLRRNADLVVRAQPAKYQETHFALYLRYLRSRHPEGTMVESSPDDYIRFLSSPWSDTKFYEIRLQENLLAISVVDHIENALSAVYTFFDPAFAQRSLGKFAILWQIEHARNLDLSWLYLGYWIKSCPKMAYKNQYKPSQGFINGKWGLMDGK